MRSSQVSTQALTSMRRADRKPARMLALRHACHASYAHERRSRRRRHPLRAAATLVILPGFSKRMTTMLLKWISAGARASVMAGALLLTLHASADPLSRDGMRLAGHDPIVDPVLPRSLGLRVMS